MFDLTAFQRDLLYVLAGYDGGTHGLAIKAGLDEVYPSEINHGRLYPNLDDLDEKGLIQKTARDVDDRTNTYRITRRGRREIKEHREWEYEQIQDVYGEVTTA